MLEDESAEANNTNTECTEVRAVAGQATAMVTIDHMTKGSVAASSIMAPGVEVVNNPPSAVMPRGNVAKGRGSSSAGGGAGSDAKRLPKVTVETGVVPVAGVIAEWKKQLMKDLLEAEGLKIKLEGVPCTGEPASELSLKQVFSIPTSTDTAQCASGSSSPANTTSLVCLTVIILLKSDQGCRPRYSMPPSRSRASTTRWSSWVPNRTSPWTLSDTWLLRTGALPQTTVDNLWNHSSGSSWRATLGLNPDFSARAL